MNFINNEDQFKIKIDNFDVNTIAKEETLLAIGNGLIVSRACNDETRNYEYRETYMSGFYNKNNSFEVEELVNLPDVFEYTLQINEHYVDLNSATMHNYEKILDLKYGYLTRSFEVYHDEMILKIKTLKYFDQLDKNSAIFNLSITCDRDAKIKVIDKIDGTYTNNGSEHFINEEKSVNENRLQYLAYTTNENKIYISSELTCNEKHSTSYKISRKTISRTTSLDILKNKEVNFDKVITYSTNEFYESRHNKQMHEKKREELWKKTCLEINSEHSYQNVLNFANYHLLLNANLADSNVNLAAKGLTGHGYKGHVFWDTEVLLLPYYITNFSQESKNLLIYRSKSLGLALKKALKHNYQGAMFSWEQTTPYSEDQTPEYGPINIQTKKAEKIVNSEIEIHINNAIIYGFDYYYEQTKDLEFIKQYASELLVANAKFFISRMTYNQKLDYYEILNVIGPDEYKEHVDNNAYINFMTKYNLLLINKYEKLGVIDEELLKSYDISLSNIIEIANKIKIQEPNENLLINQTDTYLQLKEIDLSEFKKANNVAEINKKYSMAQKNEIQVSKQADLVLLFQIFKNLYDEKIIKTNFTYYEQRCLHDSSLSLATHSIVAADLGMIDFSEELFVKSFAIDFTGSLTSSDVGIHFASMGGMWLNIVRGFCQVDPFNGLDISPNIPENISNISFTYEYEQSHLKLEFNVNDFTIKNTSINTINFTSYNDKYQLPANQSLTIKRKTHD